MMLSSYKTEMMKLSEGMSEKELDKYQVNHLINLSVLLKSCEDQDVIKLMLSLKSQLQHDEPVYKKYMKDYQSLTSIVASRFGYKEKNSVQSHYMAMGIAFGSLMGITLMNLFNFSLAIGVALGMTIGNGIGQQKEKELEKLEKLF